MGGESGELRKVLYPFYEDEKNWKKKDMKLTQDFKVKNPIYEQFGFTHHNGKDLAPIKRGAKLPFYLHEGIVDQVGYDRKGYGTYIRLRDDKQNCWWLYAHLDLVNVYNSKNVKIRELGGIIGNTGFSTNVHLHLECIPFNYRENHNNGTLGRVDYQFTLYREENFEMTEAQMTEIKAFIKQENENTREWMAQHISRHFEERKDRKNKGRYLQNHGGEIREYNPAGKVTQVFSSMTACFLAGWTKKEVNEAKMI